MKEQEQGQRTTTKKTREYRARKSRKTQEEDPRDCRIGQNNLKHHRIRQVFKEGVNKNSNKEGTGKKHGLCVGENKEGS
jgi:hypothetical protein